MTRAHISMKSASSLDEAIRAPPGTGGRKALQVLKAAGLCSAHASGCGFTLASVIPQESSPTYQPGFERCSHPICTLANAALIINGAGENRLQHLNKTD